MFFLNATDPATIKLTKKVMIDWGYKAQRLAYRVAKRLGLAQRADEAPAGDHRQAGAARRRSSTSSTSRCPAACRSARRARCSTSRTTAIVPIIRDPRKVERRLRRGVLFSRLRLGAAVLAGGARHAGDALPRRRADACCRRAICAAAIRRPRRATTTQGQKIITDNRVLFHRVANTLNYLDIKTVIVSCGTCMDQLQKYEFEKIFPGCRLLDIHEYLLEKGVKLDGVDGRALHVPRPLPHADEDLRAAEGRERADGSGRAR